MRVAADMGVYRHILTHFSQRYPKIPKGIPSSGKGPLLLSPLQMPPKVGSCYIATNGPA